MTPTEARLLRLYRNATDRGRGMPLYRAVVEAALARKLAGDSVFPVELSFGDHPRLRDAASDYAFAEIPVVVEVVDSPGQVAALLADLGPLVGGGLTTVATVRVVPHPLRTPAMMTEEGAQRVTIYLGSSDTWHGRNLALAIVERCRELGMAGATVTRGIMGFGPHRRLHRAHMLGLSDDLPERIEVIDHPERIARLLPALDAMAAGALVVLEDVQVIGPRSAPAP